MFGPDRLPGLNRIIRDPLFAGFDDVDCKGLAPRPIIGAKASLQ